MILPAAIFAAAAAAAAPALPDPAPKDVPELMVAFGGGKIESHDDWEKVRRPELLRRFLERMYGVLPPAAEHPEVSFSREKPDCTMMGGKAVRAMPRISYRGPHGANGFTACAFIPLSERPAPAFILICNRQPDENIDPERAVKSGFWPAEEIVARGYAAVAFFNGDVAPETRNPETAHISGVFPCFERPQDRTDKSWATLRAWAWGASRVMDWIETEPRIDAKRVAVVGHSRGGKTALLAAATDARFAMACVNCSGCGGMKLAHTRLPRSEHYDDFLNSRLIYWFCGAFQRYCVNKDRGGPRGKYALDFDQHELAALVAPRLLAVASATEDHWAGQPAEFLAAKLASPAWRLYGLDGIAEDAAFPAPDSPLQNGCVSYHVRTGKHDLTPYDWGVYMDFADAHGWRSPEGGRAGARPGKENGRNL